MRFKRLIVLSFALTTIASTISACTTKQFDYQQPNLDGFNVLSNKTEVDLYNATSFSEGKAVVIYKDVDGGNYCKAGVLNTDGGIKEAKDVYITVLENDEDEITTPVDWSGFQGGYAYVDYTDKVTDTNTTYERFVILDTKGKVTAISPLDADYTILCGGDGVFLVEQATKSTLSTSSTTKWGIINHEGKWICSLREPDDYYSKNMTNRNDITYTYCGERIFAFVQFKSDYDTYNGEWLSLFNADTNTYVDFEDIELLSDFSDGTALAYKTMAGYSTSKSTEIYSVNTNDFGLEPLFTDVAFNGSIGQKLSIASRPVLSGGYIFGVEQIDYSKPYDPFVGPKRKLCSTFFDIKGNAGIELEEYNFVFFSDSKKRNLFSFANGMAVVHISGKAFSYYVTTINEKGEFLYEPIKVERCINYDKEIDMISVIVEQNIDGSTYERNAFINAKTGKLMVKDFELQGEWNNGFCLENSCFYNMDGNKLITYVK